MLWTREMIWDWMETHYADVLRASDRIHRQRRGWRVPGLHSDDVAHAVLAQIVEKAPVEAPATFITYLSVALRYEVNNRKRAARYREHESLDVLEDHAE